MIMRSLAICLFFFSIVDALSTMYLMRFRGFYEANPIMALIVKRVSPMYWVSGKILFSALVIYALYRLLAVYSRTSGLLKPILFISVPLGIYAYVMCRHASYIWSVAWK